MKAKYVNPLAFEKAEIANYTPEEGSEYEHSLKTYRDSKGVIDTAFDEGKIEVAIKMKQKGLSSKDISDITGLSEGDIEKL